jgi:hypothetical protein
MSQNLATANYTLSSFKANVRSASGTLSQQESGIIDLQLIDLIHNSVLMVRAMMGKMINNFYVTRQALSMTISSGAGSVDISTYSIADINGISLFDSSATTLLKEIPIVSNAQFNAIKTLYPVASMSLTSAVATIKSSGTPYANKIYLHGNSALADTETLHMFYPRNPVKVTADADTIDLPDFLIPIAQDMTTISVFRRLSKAAPMDIENRVTSFINSQVNQLGLQVSPQN